MKFKSLIICITILFTSFLGWSQEEKKVISDFDNDNLSDTLSYKDYRFIEEYRNKYISYTCKIKRGNGKALNFNLPLGYESVQISKCNLKGCIETYQWKTGTAGFEIYETFIYKKQYDNWILEKMVTIYNDGSREIYKSKKPTGIDGTEYKNIKKKK